MLAITVTSAWDLHIVDGQIHDWFFDADDIRFDAESEELTIPFRRWSQEQARVVRRRRAGWLGRFAKIDRETWRAPWHRWYLCIHEVIDHSIEDDAQIGGSSFAEIDYDEPSRTLTIDGNVPFTIKATVQSLHVSLESTDEVLGIAEYTTEGSSVSCTGEVLPLG